MANIEEKSNLKVEKKEIPEMTFEQIVKMVELMTNGMSEASAREEPMKDV